MILNEMVHCALVPRSILTPESEGVRLNTLDNGQTPEVCFMSDSFLPMIDLLIAALSSRLKAYGEISNRFGVLRLLDQLSADEVRLAATKLVDT